MNVLTVGRYHLIAGRLHDAAELVRRYHYSGRPIMNASLVLTLHEAGGLFGFSGPAVAAIVFSVPPGGWHGISALELSRLVRRDDVSVPLTGLISAAVRWLRQHRTTSLLLSYADPDAGHHGGVYQAASWRYHGQREPGKTGLMIHGVFVPARSVNQVWGTSSPHRLAERGIVATVVHGDGKHLYWKPLNRAGERLADARGLQSEPYPKPGTAVPS